MTTLDRFSSVTSASLLKNDNIFFHYYMISKYRRESDSRWIARPALTPGSIRDRFQRPQKSFSPVNLSDRLTGRIK